jgi:hypothetical protein
VSKAENKAIVDLDLVVEKWIMWMWEKTKTKQASKYEFEDMDVIVNWSRVELIQDEAKFESAGDFNARNLFANNKPKTQTLFRTYFTNNTDMEQEYSFKTERMTRQACCFTFSKGFSREKEGGLTFKIPNEIVEIGGGIRSEHSIECGKDQTKEEEVSWGVDSMIHVKPHSRTVASLVVNEIELDRRFTVETRLKGRIVVTLNNRRENNAFFKSFSGDIVEIISKALENYWVPASAAIFDVTVAADGQKYARTVVKGCCKFRLGVEQHVTLNEEPI